MRSKIKPSRPGVGQQRFAFGDEAPLVVWCGSETRGRRVELTARDDKLSLKQEIFTDEDLQTEIWEGVDCPTSRKFAQLLGDVWATELRKPRDYDRLGTDEVFDVALDQWLRNDASLVCSNVNTGYSVREVPTFSGSMEWRVCDDVGTVDRFDSEAEARAKLQRLVVEAVG